MTGEVGYFQTGTYGPASDSVLQAVRETMESEARHGPATPAGRQAHTEREAAARSGLARLLNVHEEELGIETNTSRAMQQIVRGLGWQAGDEFVMTTLEHVSTYGLSYSLTQEHGVTVKVLEADVEDEVLLADLAAALNERTRLVCLSHIASPNGRFLLSKRQPPLPMTLAFPSCSTSRSQSGRCRWTCARSTVTLPSVQATNGYSAPWERDTCLSLRGNCPASNPI